jgi:hypothetical protein
MARTCTLRSKKILSNLAPRVANRQVGVAYGTMRHCVSKRSPCVMDQPNVTAKMQRHLLDLLGYRTSSSGLFDMSRQHPPLFCNMPVAVLHCPAENGSFLVGHYRQLAVALGACTSRRFKIHEHWTNFPDASPPENARGIDLFPGIPRTNRKS